MLQTEDLRPVAGGGVYGGGGLSYLEAQTWRCDELSARRSIGVIWGLYWGYIGRVYGVTLGLYRGYMGVILGLYRGYMGLYWGYIGVILGLYRGYIGITENNMKTPI